MEPDQQLLLAGLVREHLTHLEDVLAEIVERDKPLSALEAKLLLESATDRLEPVERELRKSTRTIGSPARQVARRIRAKLRSWLGPRIGLLYHYPPKPIRMPTAYFETRPPVPAPTISVVTPSYQQGEFLERTMLSVLGQEYPALEYYVQDGGSSDGSIEIMGRYESYLAGWATAPDQGQADAINRAFTNSTGEIMGWLNSDDLLLPGALAYVAQYFVDHPQVDVVYGNRLLIDADDGQIGAWILPRHDDDVLTVADYVPQETLFWRRRIWDAAGGELDQGFSYALDWDLLLRFQAAGARMVRLPRFLGAFRVHDEQKTSVTLLVGLEEMGRLRERVHGRPVPIDEVLRRLRPYFFRHRLIHAWQRLIDRLPLSRRLLTIDPDALRQHTTVPIPPPAVTRAGLNKPPVDSQTAGDS
jgi:glycosyltransferase involved in cell wall biosynthesis